MRLVEGWKVEGWGEGDEVVRGKWLEGGLRGVIAKES